MPRASYCNCWPPRRPTTSTPTGTGWATSAKAVNAASSGNPAAIQRAEAMLSQAFVAYVRDIKHDPQCRNRLRRFGAEARGHRRPRRSRGQRPTRLARRVRRADALDEPDLHAASPAIASRMYSSEQQRRCWRSTSSGRGRCPPAGIAMSSSILRRSGCTCTRTGRWSTRCASSPAGPTRSPRRR